MDKDQIIAAWLSVFPESYISVNAGCLGGGLYCKAYLQRPGEWSNNISENDPLNFMCIVDDGNYEESHGNILCNPENKYMYASSKKWRKKSIKNITYEKLQSRFLEIKAFIIGVESEWHNNYKESIKNKLNISTIN